MTTQLQLIIIIITIIIIVIIIIIIIIIIKCVEFRLYNDSDCLEVLEPKVGPFICRSWHAADTVIDLKFPVLSEETKEEPGRCLRHNLHIASSHFNACNKGAIR